jgi:ribosomal protein S27AE
MNDTCTWTQDSSGEWDYYDTECGHAFYFTDEGPIEHEFRFCPYCGKSLVDVPYIKED